MQYYNSTKLYKCFITFHNCNNERYKTAYSLASACDLLLQEGLNKSLYCNIPHELISPSILLLGLFPIGLY